MLPDLVSVFRDVFILSRQHTLGHLNKLELRCDKLLA